MLTTEEMIDLLKAEGYVVRHRDEVRYVLSWNRTLPIPGDIDFTTEAIEKIREQITKEHLRFFEPRLGGRKGAAIYSRRAVLQIL